MASILGSRGLPSILANTRSSKGYGIPTIQKELKTKGYDVAYATLAGGLKNAETKSEPCSLSSLFYRLKKLNILNILALFSLFYRLEKMEKSFVIVDFSVRFSLKRLFWHSFSYPKDGF